MAKNLGVFHKIIWFAWLPIKMLVALFRTYGRLESFISTNNPFAYGARGIIVVALYSLFEFSFFVVPLLIFIGFFKRRKYAWVFIILSSLGNIIFSPIAMITSWEQYDLPSVAGRVIRVLLDIAIIVYYWKQRKAFHVGEKRVLRNNTEAIHTPKQSSGDEQRLSEHTYCRQCGTQMPANSIYCKRCGTKL